MRRGSTAVELALTLPILFVVLAAILDFGWLLTCRHTVLEAGRDAVRFAVRDGGDPGEVAAVAEASARAWLVALDVPCEAECVVAARPVVIEGYDAVELELSVPVRPILGVLAPRSAVRGTFTMLVE